MNLILDVGQALDLNEQDRATGSFCVTLQISTSYNLGRPQPAWKGSLLSFLTVVPVSREAPFPQEVVTGHLSVILQTAFVVGGSASTD